MQLIAGHLQIIKCIWQSLFISYTTEIQLAFYLTLLKF